MYTLYIDTHSEVITIVIYKEDEILIKKEVTSNNNHSVSTMPLLIEALNDANIDVHDLNQIIVINGPGSFTGIRIGVTIAKTLAYTLNIPIKVLSSLEIKAISFSHEEVRIIEREKNGVFVGRFNQESELQGNLLYLKNSEYHKETMDIENVKIDFNKIIVYAKKINKTHPHAVNPLYVKKIEVQK